MVDHLEDLGLAGGLCSVSVDLAKLARHPDCNEADRELLLAARDLVWRVNMLRATRLPTEEAA